MSDLAAANDRKITVAEVTFSNSISVAEHTVMMILSLVRDYLHQHEIATSGGWDIAAATARSYDVEGMQVGVIAAGGIGLAVLERMKPFNVGLHYFDFHRLPESVETNLGLTYHTSAEALAAACDIVSIHTPLTPRHGPDVQRQVLRRHEARLVYRELRPRQADRHQRAGGGAEQRPARRLRGRCLVSAAGAGRPPLAHHAAQRHDPAHLRRESLGTGPLRRRHTGDSGMFLRRQADPQRIPDRRRAANSPAEAPHSYTPGTKS